MHARCLDYSALRAQASDHLGTAQESPSMLGVRWELGFLLRFQVLPTFFELDPYKETRSLHTEWAKRQTAPA